MNKIEMKRIIMLLIVMILGVGLFGCNSENEKVNVDFKVNGTSLLAKIEKGKTLLFSDVPIEEKDKIKNLYYDVNYTEEYKNEAITEDTTIYVELENEKENIDSNEGEQIEVIKSELPVPRTSISFINYNELSDFLNNNQINSNWLCLEDIKKQNDVLNITNIDYMFHFDKEVDGQYINPFISIHLSLYSVELGTDTDKDMDVLYHSITFYFVIKEMNESSIGNLRYDFYKYENSKHIYNNLIYMYNDDKLVCEIFYYTGLNIEENWIEDFLSENLKLITMDK